MTFQLSAQSMWYNELGSKMILKVSDDGSITGSYDSAVGKATNLETLSGRLNLNSPQTIGWVVAWSKVNAVTSWSGQIMMINNIPTIITTWLLTSQTSESDEWESTLTDQDVFTPNPPSEEQIIAAKLRKGKSHPQ